jgi:nicotinate-nucleotide--dimethylbenzimidazole phosphoribosyltransferase
MALTLEQIAAHLNLLAKPPGSLGRWEELAARLCFIQQSLQPEVRPAELVIFAADHGVVAEGVSLWPSLVTTVMAEQIALGGSVSGVLSDLYEIPRRVIDVGTKTAPELKNPMLIDRRVSAGTKNLATESAMTIEEFDKAWRSGVDEAIESRHRGAKTMILGEMGIGNTTSASCLGVLLANIGVAQAIGQGAGATDDSLRKKRDVVEVASHRAKTLWGETPKLAIAEVAGFEIVAMAGFMVQAAEQSQTILLDGVIATAAALVAEAMSPGCVKCMIAAHQSAEPAHRLMLAHLGLTPMLDWSMRLGEGTGALALFPLLEGAAAWCTRTASISSIAHRLL